MTVTRASRRETATTGKQHKGDTTTNGELAFLKKLNEVGGWSLLANEPSKGMFSLQDRGFIGINKYARCGFEMVREDNVRLTEAGRLAIGQNNV